MKQLCSRGVVYTKLIKEIEVAYVLWYAQCTEYASAPALVVIVLPDSKGSVCCELQSALKVTLACQYRVIHDIQVHKRDEHSAFHVSLYIGSGCRPSWGRRQAPS